MTFPLLNISGIPFGNVTVAALILTLSVLMLCGLIQLGIIGIKFLLAADDENAPKMEWKNWLWEKVLLFSPITMKTETINKFKNYPEPEECSDGKWRIKLSTGKYLDLETPSNGTVVVSWSKDHHYYNTDCCMDSKSDFSKTSSWYEYNYTILGLVVCADILIASLSLAFFQTFVWGGLCLSVYGVRSLAKRMYKGFKTTKETTDNHEQRISDIEGANKEEES